MGVGVASAFMAIAFVLLLIDGDASSPLVITMGAVAVLMALAAWKLRRQAAEASDV